jgi:hypothetical protein
MRVLVACEFSGVVRRAFAALGHDAWSCDIIPAADSHHKHLQQDVLDVLDRDWDLLIGHPPCTYLTTAAEWAYKDGPYHQRLKPGTLSGVARRVAREQALEFFRALWEAPVPKVALENPVGVAGTRIAPASQVIQPYEFGDDASKKTCLWLRGLPLLIPEPGQRVPGRWVEYPKGSGKLVERWSNQTDAGQNRLSPSEDRGHLRSITYQGIANAMARTWGNPVEHDEQKNK